MARTGELVNFTQTISVRCKDPDALVQLLANWDREQADTDIMGYTGTHVLADRENPGHYLIIAQFAAVDPDVTAAEESPRGHRGRACVPPLRRDLPDGLSTRDLPGTAAESKITGGTGVFKGATGSGTPALVPNERRSRPARPRALSRTDPVKTSSSDPGSASRPRQPLPSRGVPGQWHLFSIHIA